MRLESLGFTQVYDYVAGKMDWAAMGLPTEGSARQHPRIGDVVRTGVPTCSPNELLGDVRARTEAAGWDVCLVVNDSGILLGRLKQRNLAQDENNLVEQVMEEGPTTVRPNTEIEPTIRRMQAANAHQLIVTQSDGRLVGVFYRQDGEKELEQG